MKILIISILSLSVQLLSLSCQNASEVFNTDNETKGKDMDKQIESYSGKQEKAVLAGGCFWCVEQPFENIDGIMSVVSGYTGGDIENPSYKQVSSGETKHREAVEITYDPALISFAEILSVYWKQFDPTDQGGSFADRGFQYTSAIFYRDEKQKEMAINSKKELDNSGKFNDPVITPVIEYKNFYKAENYHQDYYKKNPDSYWNYKEGSGRVNYIKNTWGKIKESEYPIPPDDEIKKKLTGIQYKVTRENGTERAFDNKYWDNKKPGIYVDIISGEPLFSSEDKFASGTGWPSFTKPIDPRFLNKVIDTSMGMNRVEVRSRFADSHLGHVFNDGPEPTKLRYCMNSAAMNFIPKKEMEEKGYGEYLWLVK